MTRVSKVEEGVLERWGLLELQAHKDDKERMALMELLASQEKMEQWVHRVTVDSEEKEDPLELMDHQDQPAARVSKERQVQRVHQAPKDHEEILDHRDRWEQLEREALLVRMVK